MLVSERFVCSGGRGVVAVVAFHTWVSSEGEKTRLRWSTINAVEYNMDQERNCHWLMNDLVRDDE